MESKTAKERAEEILDSLTGHLTYSYGNPKEKVAEIIAQAILSAEASGRLVGLEEGAVVADNYWPYSRGNKTALGNAIRLKGEGK